MKAFAQDADDLHVEVVDLEATADDRKIAVEPTLPQLVADHDALHGNAVGIFRRDERAPARERRGAKEREQVVGHSRRGDALHFAVDLEARIASLHLRETGDQAALFASIED